MTDSSQHLPEIQDKGNKNTGFAYAFFIMDNACRFKHSL
jgi:hypothetical protein